MVIWLIQIWELPNRVKSSQNSNGGSSTQVGKLSNLSHIPQQKPGFQFFLTYLVYVLYSPVNTQVILVLLVLKY